MSDSTKAGSRPKTEGSHARKLGSHTKTSRYFLTRPADGRKRFAEKLVYFGKVADDPLGQVVLARWLETKDDLLAGRTPRPHGETGLTLADLCNQFCTQKRDLLSSGELAPRTFDRYFKTCEMLVVHFGRTASVEGLRPEDFRNLRRKELRDVGPIALANEIQIVRSLFRFGLRLN